MDMIVIDFTNSKSIQDIHKKLQTALDFPEYYGGNWSALWDMLSGYIDYSVLIKLKGLNSLPLELRDSSKMLLKIFNRAKEQLPGFQFTTED
jgi:ribonuclease inhibitor